MTSPQQPVLLLSELDWGNVPAWLGAIGSVGALAVALFLLNGELKARHRDDEEHARAQAGAVSIWVEWSDADRLNSSAEVTILNRSSAAIYDCRVGVASPDSSDGQFSWRLPVVPPSDVALKRQLPAVRLQGQANAEWPSALGLPVVQMTFADVYGRRWRITSAGQWTQLRAPRQ